MYYLAITGLFIVACAVCVIALLECDRSRSRSGEFTNAKLLGIGGLHSAWRSRL